MELSMLHVACLVLAQATGAGEFNRMPEFQLQPSPTLRAPIDPTDRVAPEPMAAPGQSATSFNDPGALTESVGSSPGASSGAVTGGSSNFERNAFERAGSRALSDERANRPAMPRESAPNDNRFASPLVEPSRTPLGRSLQPSAAPRGPAEFVAPGGLPAASNPPQPIPDLATIPAAAAEAVLGQATALVQQAVAYDETEPESQPLSLLNAVTRADGLGRRRETVEAYWQLSAAVGERFFCREESQLMSSVSVESEFDGKLLAAARSLTLARQAAADLQLASAQERLAELISLEGDRLPMPTELPFLGRYETRIDSWFGTGNVPRRLRQLHREFPLRLTLIQRRAEAVVDFEIQLGEVLQAYQQGQVALPMLLDTIRELAGQRRAFLTEVVTYNQAIAEYSNSIVSTTLPTRTYVATLIRLPAEVGPASLRDAAVLPASNQVPVRATSPSTTMLQQPAASIAEGGAPVSALRAVRR
jgi:hypothetical protein